MAIAPQVMLNGNRLKSVGCPAAVMALLAIALALPSAAENAAAPAGWTAGVEVKKTPSSAAAAKPNNTTVIERGADAKGGTGAGGGQLHLVALLTADGQQIDRGIVWRIYQNAADAATKAKLVAENREASPTLKLPAGDYTINASFGRAHLTRKVSLKANAPAVEQFVLNAGGLRLNAMIGGKPAAAAMISYSIFSDDRDQFANRTAVMSGAKPNLIMRLNAGIYRLVSVYGDANARVETDVTVEAGKLTEASVVHAAGIATFRLVTRAGGEALPDTYWSVLAANGGTVKESVGALPTHTLAPGKYTVAAKWSGQIYKREFAVKDGETATVEVLKDGGTAATDGDEVVPSLQIKSP